MITDPNNTFSLRPNRLGGCYNLTGYSSLTSSQEDEPDTLVIASTDLGDFAIATVTPTPATGTTENAGLPEPDP